MEAESNESMMRRLMEELMEVFAERNRLHFNEVAGEFRQYFEVVTENLRGDIRLVAEGHAVLQKGLEDLRSDMKSELKEVRSLIKLSHTDLDRRHLQLESRVARLESTSPKTL